MTGSRLAAGFAAALLCCPGAPPARAEPIPDALRACDDVAEFPPFTYMQRDGGRKTDIPVGYTVDYLNQILAADGRTASIAMLPWRRCVESVRTGEYDIALNAIRTDDRARDFVLTPPYAVLTPMVYFALSRPAPALLDAASLAGLKICGQFGYTYNPDFGVPEAVVDHGAKTLAAGANMLRAGRCDVFLSDAETVAGQVLILGRSVFPETEFGSRKAPGAKVEQLTMMIGPTLPYRFGLLDLLSRGIAEMRGSGAAKLLADRYFQPSGR
jgi:polar amino acid transport system substrate-binding protein